MAQGGSQGTGGGLNRPRDCAGVIASLTCSQPHSTQNLEREETSRQDVSPSGWEVTCREWVTPAFLPGAHPHRKVGRQKLSPRTIWGSMSQSLPWWRDLLLEGPRSRSQQEWPRLHACQDPHMWDQAWGCGDKGQGPACVVFSPWRLVLPLHRILHGQHGGSARI